MMQSTGLPRDIQPMRLPTIEEIRSVRQKIASYIMRTPLVRLNTDLIQVGEDGRCGQMEVYLKLENLQSTGSFELRGATNALLNLTAKELESGIITASTGNFAQSLASTARQLRTSLTVVVPDTLPHVKKAALERFGAKILPVSFDKWWQTLVDEKYEGLHSHRFIRPSGGPDMIAGNATLAMEILEDLPDVDAVVVPYASGGLACSVGVVMKELRPRTKVIACETVSSTPFSNALAAGRPQFCQHSSTFVDSMGLNSVIPEIWPHVRRLVDHSVAVSLVDIARAIRIMVERNHIVAEGAGAAPLAAALRGHCGHGKVVCVVSGGNIDTDVLADILQGIVPPSAAGREPRSPSAASVYQHESNI